MIDPPQQNIYFYSEYQDTFGEIEVLVPGIQFIQRIPASMLDSTNPQTRNLYIIDDTMCEKDAVIAKLVYEKVSPWKPQRRLHCAKFVSSKQSSSNNFSQC